MEIKVFKPSSRHMDFRLLHPNTANLAVALKTELPNETKGQSANSLQELLNGLTTPMGSTMVEEVTIRLGDRRLRIKNH